MYHIIQLLTQITITYGFQFDQKDKCNRMQMKNLLISRCRNAAFGFLFGAFTLTQYCQPNIYCARNVFFL